ncbi:MAG: MFS transporter [Chloroflexi bacterium]|nr:MAG: MFS transporter [Chloroflexota bacterium]
MTTTSTGGRLRFTRALRSPAFALLWSGQTISALGDGAFFIALAWQILVLTRSGTAMGIVLVAQSIPRLLFLLLGGVAADRIPRRLVMLWSDGGRALLVGAIAALGWFGLLQFWVLVVLALCFGLADAFFLPAFQSIPPLLVETEALTSANALTSLSQELSILLGPALGAALVAISGASGAFAFDSLTFLISALCLLALRMPEKSAALTQRSMAAEGGPSGGVQSTEGTESTPRAGGLLADVREGLSYVMASPWLWVTILLASLANVGLAPLQVALPKLVADVYHSGVWLIGGVFSASAIGSVSATLTLGQAKRLHHRGIVAYLGTITASVALLGIGLPFPQTIAPAIALVMGALVGAGLGVFSIIWVTVLQEMIPADKLGRVTSLDWLGSLALQPVGLAVVGVLTDRLGPQWVFIGGGGLNLVLALLAFTVRGIRTLD